MNRIFHRLACLIIALSCISTAAFSQKLRVVTSLPDLASIAQEVGGDRIDVFAIAKGYQDPHFVDAKPSYMLNLQKADLFIETGLDLEIGWVPLLLDGARNSSILPGARGFLDASRNVPLLEIPSGDPTALRAQGDIHVYGNPHYWLDPLRGKVIAQNIFGALVALRPQDKTYFQNRLDIFMKKLDEKTTEWTKKLAPFKGRKIIAFHNSWPYFMERFGLTVEAFIEPKPGIPPTPKHLAGLIGLVQSKDIRVIIIEPYYNKKSAEIIASKTNAQIVELATSVGAETGIQSYFDLFDYNINKLAAAFGR